MIQSHPENIHSKGDYSFVLDTFYVYTGDKQDQFVQRYCRDYGVWDSDLTHWMIHNIKPGWVCLDIGANIGYFTELMASLSGPEGKVLSFEPNKRLVQKYLESTLINDQTNSSDIKIFDCGLSNKDEVVELVIPHNNIGAANLFNLDYAGPCIKELVRMRRLDSVYDGKIDFIKIDIEGHEEQAWEGFPQSAIDCPLIVAELGPYHSDEFLSKLEDLYDMTDLLGKPINKETIKNVTDFINAVLRRKVK